MRARGCAKQSMRKERMLLTFDESTQERTNERGENESEGLRQAEHAQREGVADLRREHTGTNERVALGEGSGKAKTRKVATKGRCPRHAIEKEKKERKERAKRKSEKKEPKERRKERASVTGEADCYILPLLSLSSLRCSSIVHERERKRRKERR